LREELPASMLPNFRAPTGFPVAKEMKHGQFQFKIDKDKPVRAEVLAEGRSASVTRRKIAPK